MRRAVLVLHERLKEVVELLADAVALETLVRASQHDCLPADARLRHFPVEGNDVGDLVENLVVIVAPQEEGLFTRRGVETLAEADLECRPVRSLRDHPVVPLIEQTEVFGEANVCNGIERKEIDPSAKVDQRLLWISVALTLGQRRGTALVNLSQHPVNFVRHLVLPAFQVLEGICRRQDLALSCMFGLVDYVGEVIMRASSEDIGLFFHAGGPVAVNVLDGLHAAK